MAVNQYLVAAAGQLESAANALRMEIDQVKGEFAAFEQQATRDLMNREADMRAMVARAATSDNGPSVAANGAQAARIKKEVEDIKKEVEKRRSEMQDAMRSKESAMTGLMSQARSLQSQAASFR